MSRKYWPRIERTGPWTVASVVRAMSRLTPAERRRVIKQAETMDAKAEYEEFLRKAKQAIERGHKLTPCPRRD